MRSPRIVIDANPAGEWWWRFVAPNGQTDHVSEVYSGVEARRDATKAAFRHRDRLAVPVDVLIRDVTSKRVRFVEAVPVR